MTRAAKAKPGPMLQGELCFRAEESADVALPRRVSAYPELRYMGSKHRLLPWIHSVLGTIPFRTAADPFVGSGCVAYLLKAMGKRVHASDFLNFPTDLASATIANSHHRLGRGDVERLLAPRRDCPDLIERTFTGIFYTREDLRFLDRVSANIGTSIIPIDKRLLGRP